MSTPAPPEVIQSDSFICDCEEWMRTICKDEAFYKEHNGKHYCILHYPGKEKAEDFSVVLKKKFGSKDFDFRGVWFPDGVDFEQFHFSSDANFMSASFSEDANFRDAIFGADADFTSTTFGADAIFFMATFTKPAHFREAIFGGDANFSMATFVSFAEFGQAAFGADATFFTTRFKTHASFRDATFDADAYFTSATFGADADFRNARFDAVAKFYDASFGDHAYFASSSEIRTSGDHPQLDLQSARFEKPDRVSLHTLNLQPHWFVNVDSRKFEFTDVEFNYDLKDELESLKKTGVSAPHRLLAIACRQLAINAEENHRYRQAADLRYASMDAELMEWRKDRKIKKFQFLRWLYWIASGYDERVTRAFWMLVALWLLFALLYTKVGFEHKTNKPSTDQLSIAVQEDHVGKPLPFKKVFTYSLGVMSLQKPDPKPVTIAAQTIVFLETILCPIQAALLALAIRRRFMR